MTTHIFNHDGQSVSIKVSESDASIDMAIDVLPTGRPVADKAFMVKWLFEILERYKDDPRPVFVTHPVTGEPARIIGDELLSAKGSAWDTARKNKGEEP